MIGESRRIVAAGGFVESGRVNGSLALSRALGDFEFKQNSFLPPEDQIVTGKQRCRPTYLAGSKNALVYHALFG